MPSVWLALVLALDAQGHIIGVRGPYPWTLQQCNSNVEIWAKMMMVPPRPPDFDERIRKYQCIMTKRGTQT